MIALLVAAALGGDPSVTPIPIGADARFRPAARTAAASTIACSNTKPLFRIHLELFAEGRVIVVPEGIGRGDAGCSGVARTTAPGGVVEVSRRNATLGDLFRIWGETLSPRRLLSFSGAVRVYIAGHLVKSDPREVVLTPHAELVLEAGPVIPPHRFYLFPKGT
jgi:hypothetical protein